MPTKKAMSLGKYMLLFLTLHLSLPPSSNYQSMTQQYFPRAISHCLDSLLQVLHGIFRPVTPFKTNSCHSEQTSCPVLRPIFSKSFSDLTRCSRSLVGGRRRAPRDPSPSPHPRRAAPRHRPPPGGFPRGGPRASGTSRSPPRRPRRRPRRPRSRGTWRGSGCPPCAPAAARCRGSASRPRGCGGARGGRTWASRSRPSDGG